MVTLGRHGGALLTGVVFAMVLGPATATAQSLPSGWASRDVGNPAMPGSSQSSGGTYTVQGAGTDIGGTSDQFQYCYRSLSGDVDVRVRVAGMQSTSAGSKFGLMIRDSMNANARNVFVLLSAEQQLAIQWRTKAGRTTGKVTGATAATPVWIRLVRKGNTFRAYSSANSSTWTQIGSTNFRMASVTYVGLAVTSHSPYQPTTGTFSGLAIGNTAPLVPAPWTARDIGSPAVAGTASESGGTFTVSGAGTDIFNSSDQFQFVYQPVSGDTQIVARVASLQAANSGSKAGVMIRADLTASAANAAMFATGAGSWVAQERLLAGDTTYQATGAAGAPPGWVKVVREGDVLSAFQSPDGNTWTLVDTDTIPMPSTVYVGLAVTSRVSTAIATATFTNVAVSVPAGANNPPTVSITAPASGANYTAPASMTISATAADSDGLVARVDFYRGSTLIGSDTTSPYSVSWSNVAAGTYSLTAVATDNDGDTTTSMPVSVTVNSTNKPPTVSITSPGSGATFTAPAGISIAATAADTDGSVTRVDFYSGGQLVASDTASPFAGVWSNVPAGTYALTAVATDNQGAKTTSAPVSLTVTAAAPPLPTKVVFVPGADYATNATSVTVELRSGGAAVTATPVATRNLGKPSVVNGEISVDISTLVDPLAAGSYYAIIVTTGAGGSAPSSPSATFSK